MERTRPRLGSGLSDGLRSFAEFPLVVDPSHQDERGRAKAILDYFGEDTDPSNTHFAVTTQNSSGQDTTYTTFELYLTNVDRPIQASENWIFLHIYKDGDLSANTERP